MWELDCEESWVLKNWCFWTVVLEKTLLSPLDCKEIQPVHPKVNQSWIFIGRTDDEAETPILWLPHAQSWLIGKDSDAGRDWGQKEKGATGDEMAGWHHRLNAHEFGWTPGVSDGQGGLECCDSWGRKESDMTERLNWTALKLSLILSVGFVFCHNDQIFISFSTKTRLFMKTNFYCNTWWKQPSLYFLFIWIFLVDLKNLVLEVNLKSTLIRTKNLYMGRWVRGFLGGSDTKESAWKAGDPDQSTGWEDPLKEDMATHSPVFQLENPTDRGAWWGYSP